MQQSMMHPALVLVPLEKIPLGEKASDPLAALVFAIPTLPMADVSPC